MKYYITQAGALFLEGKYPNMILKDGKWTEKPKKPEKWKGSSRTSTEHPNMILRDGKWTEKLK